MNKKLLIGAAVIGAAVWYFYTKKKSGNQGQSGIGANRPLYAIANEIYADWGKKIYFGARPYLEAMSSLSSVDDNYGWDSGRSIVNYFLANASSWKGETAKRVKAELKAMLKR